MQTTAEPTPDYLAEYRKLVVAACEAAQHDYDAARADLRETFMQQSEALIDAVIEAALDAMHRATIESVSAPHRAKRRRDISIALAQRPQAKGQHLERIEATLRNRLRDLE
jgi:hypothetical protein